MRRALAMLAVVLGITLALLLGLAYVFSQVMPAAHAQGAVQQLGPVTAQHVGMWAGSGTMMDAGGSPGPGLQPLNQANPGTLPTGLGTINAGYNYCGWTGYANLAYSEVCMGFDGSGNVLFLVDRVGDGFAPQCHFLINGTLIPCGGTNGMLSVSFVGDGVVDTSTPTAACSTGACVLTATVMAQAAHKVLAGPASGGAVAPTFRQLACADLSDATADCASAVDVTGTTPITVTPSGTMFDVGITIPSADLLGGDGSDFTGVSVGTDLNLTTGSLGVDACGATTLARTDCIETFSAAQTFGENYGTQVTEDTTTHTMAASDCGKSVLFTSGSASSFVALGTAVVPCVVEIEQGGAGQVTVTAGSGATLNSAHSYTATYGQYAIIWLKVDTNSDGSSAHYVISGDGA